MAEFLEVRENKKLSEEREKKIKASILAEMGDASIAETAISGSIKVSKSKRSSVDTKKLKREFPDVFAACAKVSESTRITYRKGSYNG